YWHSALKDTAFMKSMKLHNFPNAYRHMIIRFASMTDDPSVVTTTMEYIKDTLTVTDSLRAETEEFLLKYLDKYGLPKYHDQLISVLSAITYLKPKNDTFKIKLNNIYTLAANTWGDQMVVDSTAQALAAIGEHSAGKKAILLRQ